MKTYSQRNIAERLDQAQEVLAIAQEDAEINAGLADFGFIESRFSDGMRLLEAASSLETEQRAQLGAQVTATRAMKALFISLMRKFRTDRRVAQTVLRSNPDLYEELRLHLKIALSQEGFIRQAIHFYQEIIKHETVMTALANEYNLTEAIFASRQEELNRLLEARQEQQLMIGKAQVATQLRRAAMEDLDSYMNDLIGVARLAFKKNERQLRKLGIAVVLTS